MSEAVWSSFPTNEEIAAEKRADLRDQFAMAALTGLLHTTSGRLELFAHEAYAYADAMMRARERE